MSQWFAEYGAVNGTQLTIRRESVDAPDVKRLFLALNAELSLLYTEDGANHFGLAAHEVTEGRGALFVAYDGTVAVGCSAIRQIDNDTAELKRMYVIPQARGLGVALQLTLALEDEARKLGVRRLVLETGDRQPEARALAEKLGFVRIEPFGEYANSPLSVCMGKKLG